MAIIDTIKVIVKNIPRESELTAQIRVDLRPILV